MESEHHAGAAQAPGAISRRDVIRATGGAVLAGVGAAALSLGEASTGPPSAAMELASGRTALAGGGATQLLIEDGSPHWHSPDIWVVPGTDPNGPAGSPVAGDTAYVYARVTNTGTTEATDAQVRFYWGDPSAQLYFSTMNPIGSAFVTIPAGGTMEVLCVTPWQVTIVNNGHECLVVSAQLPDEAPLPDAVEVMAHPNVAQRNLTVVQPLGPTRTITQTVRVAPPPGATAPALMAATVGGVLPAGTLASLGLRQRVAASTPAVSVGLSRVPVPGGVGQPELTVNVLSGQSTVVYLTVRATRALRAEEYQLVTVTQRHGGQLVGGVSFVVTGP